MFPSMAIYPEKLRLTFEKLIDWIDLRAAERSQGLGTKFPFSDGHIIESLSDSTIYMCFYTFVPHTEGEKIKPEQLKPEFFDYVLLGNGSADSVAASTGIDANSKKNAGNPSNTGTGTHQGIPRPTWCRTTSRCTYSTMSAY